MSKKFLSKTSTPFKRALTGVFRNTRSGKSSVDSEELADQTVIVNPRKLIKIDSKMSSKLEFRDLITMIRPFDGTRTAYKYFVQDCERVLALADGRTQELLLHYIISTLSSLKLDCVLVHCKGTWNDLKMVLNEHFGSKLNASDILHDLMRVRRGKETLFEYYNKFTVLLSDYRDSIDSQYQEDGIAKAAIVRHAEKIALDSFIKGLNVELRASVLIKEPQTLQDSYKLARHLEDKLTDRADLDVDRLADTIKLLLKDKEQSSSFEKPIIRQVEVVICQICSKEGHGARNCSLTQSRRLNNDVVCQLCGKTGHSAGHCYSLKNNGGERKKSNNGRYFWKGKNNDKESK